MGGLGAWNSMDSVLSIVLVSGALLAMLSIVYVSWSNGISPMPTSFLVRHVVTNEVKRMGKTGTMVDAGSGFGTLAVHMALHCPGWKIIGIENSPVPRWVSWMYSKCRIAMNKSINDNISFVNGNLFTYSYEDVDLIVCYLYPGAMERLSGMVEHLKPGTQIISICFALPGHVPERVIICKDMYQTKVYVYDITAAISRKSE